MKTTIVHISEIVANKRVKMCDGTPLISPGDISTNNEGTKALCEACRTTFRNRETQ